MRPKRRKQRRRVFLGCEGESERGYGAFLGQLLETRRQDTHIDVVLLTPGGGDPLELVKRAQARLEQAQRRGEPEYLVKALLLDSDLRGHNALNDRNTERAGKKPWSVTHMAGAVL